MEHKKNSLELVCAIVNFGYGSKLLKSARCHGFSGGTVTLGRGTAREKWLDFLGLSDVRKEIVYLAADTETAHRALEAMNQEFHFEKPNHGIVFTTSICSVHGTKTITCKDEELKKGGNQPMQQIITVIVDKGKAEDVVSAAEKAGSKGGTILNGRGAGVHETSKVFAMEIEMEKEIVLILTETEKTEAIVQAIGEKLHIDDPGNGIIFVQDVHRSYGVQR